MINERKLQENLSSAQKEQSLRDMMRNFGRVLVAYSGGVDSAYLALIATEELGRDAVCVTGISPSVSKIQREQAEKIARKFAFNYETIETFEMENDDYMANPSNHCYFCKSELYTKFDELALDRNINFIIDGANADDLRDYRPGGRAASERSIISPLAKIGFSKSEIRERSKLLHLETWDKPASPCLASRIQYGLPVSIKRLSKVEKGENFLREMGFREFRVRIHDQLVRIEIAAEEMEKVLNKDIFSDLSTFFKRLDFKYVTLDLSGFRSGAMNETLSKNLIAKSIDAN